MSKTRSALKSWKSCPIFTLSTVAGRLKRGLTMVLSMFCLRAFAVCQKRAILAFTKKNVLKGKWSRYVFYEYTYLDLYKKGIFDNTFFCNLTVHCHTVKELSDFTTLFICCVIGSTLLLRLWRRNFCVYPPFFLRFTSVAQKFTTKNSTYLHTRMEHVR